MTVHESCLGEREGSVREGGYKIFSADKARLDSDKSYKINLLTKVEIEG